MSKNKIEALFRAPSTRCCQHRDGMSPTRTRLRFEVVMPDTTRADYVLCDHNGRSPAVCARHGFDAGRVDCV